MLLSAVNQTPNVKHITALEINYIHLGFNIGAPFGRKLPICYYTPLISKLC